MPRRPPQRETGSARRAWAESSQLHGARRANGSNTLEIKLALRSCRSSRAAAALSRARRRLGQARGVAHAALEALLLLPGQLVLSPVARAASPAEVALLAAGALEHLVEATTGEATA